MEMRLPYAVRKLGKMHLVPMIIYEMLALINCFIILMIFGHFLYLTAAQFQQARSSGYPI